MKNVYQIIGEIQMAEAVFHVSVIYLGLYLNNATNKVNVNVNLVLVVNIVINVKMAFMILVLVDASMLFIYRL